MLYTIKEPGRGLIPLRGKVHILVVDLTFVPCKH